MAKLLIEIDKCNKCPFVKCEGVYTQDSFECECNYKCGKNNRTIATYIEYNREMPEVPNWCPIKV
jgi:hypothetical protein